MYKGFFLVVLAAGVAAFAVSGCDDGEANGQIVATGTIDATEVEIATKSTGIIVALYPQEGDRVATGQVLALIDHADLDWQLKQAQSGLALARANLRLAVNGPLPEDIARAEAAVEQAQAQFDGARKDFERVEQLAAQGTATRKQLDDAATRKRSVEAGLAMARAALSKLRAGTRPEQIAAARARVAQAEANIGAIRQRIDDATIRSPVRGVVTHRLAEPGEMAAPGSSLLTVTALDEVWLKVYLSTTEVGRISLGDTVDVYLDAEPNRARVGRVTYISSTAEFTPKNVQTKKDRVKLVFAVKVGLDNNDGVLNPGLPADAVFRAGRHAQDN